MDEAQLRSLRLRAHVHTDRCYGEYVPCGEHHVHSGPPDPPELWCGNKRRICGQQEDPDLVALLAAFDEMREALKGLAARLREPPT